MAGEAQDFRRQRDEARDRGIVGIEAAGADALGIDALPIPPLHAPRKLVDLREIEPQRLAHVAQSAARSVADDGGRQRRTLPAILVINILNDFFAPLVLEIHVDVRRFVALLGNEALEQHGHARRVHLGDPQAVTDGGVGRGAAALAEDSLRARMLDDIVHGQEEGFEFEFGDQAQFVLDMVAHGGSALRPASAARSPAWSARANDSWASRRQARSPRDIRSAIHRE